MCETGIIRLEPSGRPLVRQQLQKKFVNRTAKDVVDQQFFRSAIQQGRIYTGIITDKCLKRTEAVRMDMLRVFHLYGMEVVLSVNYKINL